MKKRAVIIGGGITGLRIGVYLVEAGWSVQLLEKTTKVGGMVASFAYNDCILDYGPHKFYTQLPGVYADFKEIVGKSEYYEVPKKNSIYLQGKYFTFPAKIGQLAFGLNPLVSAQLGLDILRAKLHPRKVLSYEDYFVNGFGTTGYSLIFKGFAEKVWGDPTKLSPELARRRSPASSAWDVVKSALFTTKNVSADIFLYPKKGYGVITTRLAERFVKGGGKIHYNVELTNITHAKGNITGVLYKEKKKVKKIPAEVVVATNALPHIVALCTPTLSPHTIRAAEKLHYRSLIIAYIVVKKNRLLKDNWLFFPEKGISFNRVAEQKSFSPDTVPEGKTVLTAEITCSFGDELYTASDETIKERVLADLKKVGILKDETILDFFTRKAGRVYPVYDKDYQKNLTLVFTELDKIKGLYPNGRLGLFNYNNADHCLDMAKVTSEIILNNKGIASWQAARRYFDAYRIVD